MIEKAFNNKKDIAKFKKEYSSGNIETEVISNLLQPYHEDKYPAIKEYSNFLIDKLNFPAVMMLSQYGQFALFEKFGKHDFTFVGNRTYKNYILKYEDLIIVGHAKREVVIGKERSKSEFIEQLIKFEIEYAQLVMDVIWENRDKLEDFDKKCLEKLEQKKLLSKDGKFINYGKMKS